MPQLKNTQLNNAMRRLENVVTIKEIAQLYGLSLSGVMYHLDAGSFAAVQTLGGVYVADLPSVILGMGIPPYPGRVCRNINWRQLLDEKSEENEPPDSVWWTG